MPAPSVSYKTLRALRPSLVATAFAAAAFLAAAPASADECMNDSDCGFGFACETVVTSSITTGTGGAGGTAGIGTSGTGTAGTSGASGTTGSGNGGAAAGGTSGDVPGGTGGMAPRPGPVCGNSYCETPTESPATCPADCVFTTICTGAICTDDVQCASGYTCPSPGSVGTGGGPNTAFCGDSLCSTNEDTLSCPFDCDPNYRRCSPGNRGCQSDLDCIAGFVCVYSGGGGSGGTAGASGSAGSTSTGGLPGNGAATGGAAGTGVAGSVPAAGSSGSADPAAGTGGTGFGGSVSNGGSAGMVGGSAGISQVGMCIPGGVGGTTGVGGDYYGGVGGTAAGTPGSGGASGGVGGTTGADDGDVIVTHGGCSMANGSASSSLASLLLGAVALLRFGRRRTPRTR